MTDETAGAGGKGAQTARAAGASLRRRRQHNVDGGRTKKTKVMLSTEEHALLTMRAEQEHMTIPRLLVACALDPEMRAASAPADGAPVAATRRQEAIEAVQRGTELRNLLAAIGSNLNQIARHANATGELGEDAAAAVDAAMRACDRVTEAVRGVSVPRGGGTAGR
ncbi:hypothetical protein AXK56_16475 [Tsukamurella pulmonis]|uniref:Mobilisation protein (MobC) n=1 Tax=Tsukamurella pulmonis TaxID=47312 RepID=A0A1H1A8R2_9ACTN|nr:plasmid mobilization relaxosome protein MobC [Tsukamurella pulmonis]KXO95806.1 hypothetical protein AXK56_16475 [Tsukamurella pulmonis]SDQ36024.1 mobilisation protein (MobC) [Tsukamurella pulmonis]SUQ39431.1 Bacterial mobilisation protein (MobC) [Tsukamurella pulmonis]